ncbi:MAG: TolC family protein [Muribaculaceae bacterium]|nr:TolC family protein [Muribaculaceae bacterium]
MRKFLMIVAACSVMSVHAAELPLTVGQLFERVETQSRALGAARAAVDVARQGVEVARSAWLPDVGANLSISYLGNTLITSREFDEAQWAHTPHLGNSLSLEAQQVVYSGGAIPASVRLAELQQRQAETGVDLTRQQQRFLALGQYLDLFRLNNRMRVYEQNIALTRTLIDNIR